MLDSVLFDLDGTLLDTVDDFLAIIRSMRQDRGLADSSLQLIRSTVSDGSAGMLCAAFSITPEHDEFAALRSRTISSALCLWLIRTTSCSMIGPASSSSVT